METKKSQTVNLRTSPNETELLKQAAEKLSQQTGEKQNISKAIIQAVKQFNDPEVYYVDERKYEALCASYQSNYEHLQRVVSGFNALGMGAMSPEIFRQLSRRDWLQLEKAVYQDIEKNLAKTGITNPAMLADLRKGADKPYWHYKRTSELELLHVSQTVDLDMFTLKDGILSFDDSDRKRLKEKYCTYFIDSNSREQFKQLTEIALKALQDIKDICLKSDIHNPLFGDLFSETDEVVTLNKSVISNI